MFFSHASMSYAKMTKSPNTANSLKVSKMETMISNWYLVLDNIFDASLNVVLTKHGLYSAAEIGEVSTDSDIRVKSFQGSYLECFDQAKNYLAK